MKQNKYDVVCLQETHITKNASEALKKEWGGELLYREHTANSAGQVVMFRKCLACNTELGNYLQGLCGKSRFGWQAKCNSKYLCPKCDER